MKARWKMSIVISVVSAVILLLPTGCQSAPRGQLVGGSVATETSSSPVPTEALTSTFTATQTPLATPTRTPTALPSPTLTPSPLPTATRPPVLIAIDAGHGGLDLGARHFDGAGQMDFCESRVNLDLALRVRDLLLARGYNVLLTREEDVYMNPDFVDANGDNRVDYLDDLQTRLDMINEAQADLLLSIHQNAYEGPSAEKVGGTTTFYCSHRPFGEQSLRFARAVQDELLQAFSELGYDTDDRDVQDDTVLQESGKPGAHLVLLGPQSERIVRPSDMPGALSEPLFITHRREAEFARDPRALGLLAEAYAQAIDAYFAEMPPSR